MKEVSTHIQSALAKIAQTMPVHRAHLLTGQYGTSIFEQVGELKGGWLHNE